MLWMLCLLNKQGFFLTFLKKEKENFSQTGWGEALLDLLSRRTPN